MFLNFKYCLKYIQSEQGADNVTIQKIRKKK